MVEKYENIDKFLQGIDGLLGTISSIPWWGWVLIVLVLLIGPETLLDAIFGIPKALWQFAKRDTLCFVTLIAAETGAIIFMVFAYKELPENLQQHLSIYVSVAIFTCMVLWLLIVDAFRPRNPSDNHSSQ